MNILRTVVSATLKRVQLSSTKSNIVKKDKKLLQEAVEKFRLKSKNYEDSWGYIIQSTRYGGFKWYDEFTGMLIFFGRKSYSDPTLIIPAFFSSHKHLMTIVERMENNLGVSKTILKNVDSKDIPQLKKYGFREYFDSENWDKKARFDDQTYPQVIIDLEKMIEAKGKNYQNLRTVLNKKNRFKIRKYSKRDRKSVSQIFYLKDKVSRDKFSGSLESGYFETHEMYLNADLEKFVITKNSGEVIGFTAVSNISSETFGLVAGLFIPDEKHAAIWGLYQTMLLKYNEGLKYANLGGSEFENTYRFKREKFMPTQELKKTHLVYDRTA